MKLGIEVNRPHQQPGISLVKEIQPKSQEVIPAPKNLRQEAEDTKSTYQVNRETRAG